MTKPIPRSRLHITYRTKIDGTPKRAELPMRFLVLGDFTSHDQRGLNEREVHSIMPGMQLSSFMDELQLSSRIDDPGLAQRIPAKFRGKLTAKWKAKPPIDEANPPAEDAEAKGTVKLSGTGVVSGDLADNGFGSFAGEVEISGDLEVDCKFSGGEWMLDEEKVYAATYEKGLRLFGKVEPAADTELGKDGLCGNVEQLKSGTTDQYEAQAISNFKLTQLPEDADAAVNVDPTDALPETQVDAEQVWVNLTIPLRHMTHFKPSHLAAMVPEIRRLVLLRSLALETRNYLANYPELRDLVKLKLNEDRVNKTTVFQDLRAELRSLYPQLLVDPTPAPAADGDSEPEPESN